MSLVTRFSVFFLVVLALSLGAFSGCLYYLVGLQLSVALDQDLEATLDGFPANLASRSERVSWAVCSDQRQGKRPLPPSLWPPSRDETPRLVPWHCLADPSCVSVIGLDRHEVKETSGGK